VDKNHPFLIEPERYHHVIITGKVKFKVEFYKIEEKVKESGGLLQVLCKLKKLM